MFEIFKIVTTSLLGLVSGASLVYLKYYLDNRKKPGGTFDADLDRRNRVKEFLLDVLATEKPARTSAYLLHNGGTLFNGDHMQRMKLYEEVTRDHKVSMLRKDFDGVLIEGPLHFWVDSMRQNIKKEGELYEEFIARSQKDVTNKEFVDLMKHYGVHAQYAQLIRNPQTNAPVAIFAASFDTEQPFHGEDLVGYRQAAKRLQKIVMAKL